MVAALRQPRVLKAHIAQAVQQQVVHNVPAAHPAQAYNVVPLQVLLHNALRAAVQVQQPIAPVAALRLAHNARAAVLAHPRNVLVQSPRVPAAVSRHVLRVAYRTLRVAAVAAQAEVAIPEVRVAVQAVVTPAVAVQVEVIPAVAVAAAEVTPEAEAIVAEAVVAAVAVEATAAADKQSHIV